MVGTLKEEVGGGEADVKILRGGAGTGGEEGACAGAAAICVCTGES